MAAGQGFKTFTTGEVLTAADTNGYLMQGVLVFADATARDAAITSPQEGQFAYLKDTNVTTYYTGSAWANLDTTGMVNPMTTTGDTIYSSSGSTPARLGIGSSGQVLTVAGGVPTWATAPSGGMTLLSTTTLSGGTTTISSISQSYTDLQIVIYGYTNATANGQPRMYPNAVTNITDYSGTERQAATNGFAGTDNGPIYFGFQNGDRASALNSGVCVIKNYANTTFYKDFDIRGGYKMLTTSVASYNYGGQIKTTSAISSLAFYADGGTFSTGTVLIYGVK